MPARNEPRQRQRHEGYFGAGAWLAQDADNETFIFRKFDKLTAINLLYMQSEIMELERKIDEMHERCFGSDDPDLKDVAATWEVLIDQDDLSEEHRKEAQERLDVIEELRTKLKKYHKALLLQSQIAQLKHPDSRVLAAVRHFFQKPHPILGGKAKEFLNNRDDLVAVKSPAEVDYLSSWLRRHWAYDKEAARDDVNQFGRFNESSISLAVTIVTIIVAAVFLFAPIIGFNLASGAVVKLVMISVLTALFAGSLGLITNARRAEIFGATAAYAAVLVVFVSSGGLSPT